MMRRASILNCSWLSPRDREAMAEPIELQLSAQFEEARLRYLAGDMEAPVSILRNSEVAS